jgi:hypothetical protein
MFEDKGGGPSHSGSVTAENLFFLSKMLLSPPASIKAAFGDFKP